MNSQKFLKKITFISLIKDNPEDTLILLKYLSSLNFKISHLIADGSKNNQKRIFEKFNNLKFKYYYFGEDKDYKALYKKIYKTLNKVKTKYVYFLDQGDYLNFDTLISFQKVMEMNNQFSCALGEVFNFKIKNEEIKLISKNIYNFKITKTKSVLSRVLSNFQSRSYHALHKTNILKKSVNIINKFKIDDPRTAELIIDTNNLINGNIYRSKNVLLLHNATKTNNTTTLLNKKHGSRKIWYDQYFKKKFQLVLKKLMKVNKIYISKEQIKYAKEHFVKNDINLSIKIKQNFFKKVFLKVELMNIKQKNLLSFLKKIKILTN